MTIYLLFDYQIIDHVFSICTYSSEIATLNLSRDLTLLRKYIWYILKINLALFTVIINGIGNLVKTFEKLAFFDL